MVGKVVGRHPEIKVLGLGLTDPQTKEYILHRSVCNNEFYRD